MSLKSAFRPLYRSIKLSLKYPLAARVKVVSDYLSLYRSKGLSIDEYFDFEFEKRDVSFRKAFLGLNEQRYYLDYLNPIKYYSLSRNKYFAHKALDNTGVRKTELYCYYQPEARYFASEECAGSLQDVLSILRAKNVQSCVIKTTESSHGDNVRVVNSIVYQDKDALLSCFDGSEVPLSSLLGEDALIFEGIVHQTDQFASFNESSVNTLRFMTTLWPDGAARVIAVFIKIGRHGRCVDNAGGGGNVDCCVDIETGEIKYAVQFDGFRRIKDIDFHPDSGQKLNGVVVENWLSIREEVERFQQSFPFCKAAGWDIAITNQGPVVIEVNEFWDRIGQVFVRKGWRKEIRDCYLAWKNTGKEYKMYRQPNELKLNHLIQISSHE